MPEEPYAKRRRVDKVAGPSDEAAAAAKRTIPLDGDAKRRFINFCNSNKYEEAAALIDEVSDEDKKILANLKDEASGYNALMSAAHNGHIQVVKLLLDSGAEINQARTSDGATALTMAARNGHTQVVRLLLGRDVDINQATTNNGTTALVEAVLNGRVEVVRLLLGSGANPNQATTDYGNTALMAAAHNGHVAIVESLLDSGAEINQVTTNNSVTALMAAVQGGHVEVVELLLGRGAEINQATTNNGTTALTLAAANGHVAIVESLLERDADPNQRDDGGGTALMEAAANGHVAIVESLLKRGADLNQRDDGGVIALMEAAANGHVAIVESLLERGADPNQRDDDGSTALMEAAANGHVAIVESLLNCDANPINNLNLIARFCNHPNINITDAHRLNFDNVLRIIIEHDRTNVAFDKPGGFNIRQLNDDAKALIDQLYQIRDVDNSFEQLWDKITARVRDQENPVSAILLDYMLQKAVEKGGEEALIAKLRPSVTASLDGTVRRVEEPSLLVEAAITANLGAVKVLLKYGADIGAMSLGDSVVSHVAQYVASLDREAIAVESSAEFLQQVGQEVSQAVTIRTLTRKILTDISTSLAQDGESAVAAGVDAVPVEMAEAGGAAPKAATAQAVPAPTPAQMMVEKFLPVIRFLIEKSPDFDRSIMEPFEELRLAGIDFISHVPALKAIDEQAQRAKAAERELVGLRAQLAALRGGSLGAGGAAGGASYSVVGGAAGGAAASSTDLGGGKASKPAEVIKGGGSQPKVKPSAYYIEPAHSGGFSLPSGRSRRG